MTIGPNPGMGQVISQIGEAVGNKPASERIQPRWSLMPLTMRLRVSVAGHIDPPIDGILET